MKRRDALAVLGTALLSPPGFKTEKRRNIVKREIKTDKAPKAIGPYSQAVAANGFVFVSGQIPLDPATGEVVPGGIEEQTRRVLQNVAAVLEAAGSSPADAVKATVFLQDMNDFSRMNTVYQEFFPAPYPARAAVQAARLPRDVKVEVEVVALLKS